MNDSVLIFPDGRRKELDGDVVVGRAPIAPPSSPSAASVSLSVPTVSKTHALFGESADGPWVVDLGSSNGTEVLDPSGRAQRLEAGQRTPIPGGHNVRLGTDTVVSIAAGAAAPAAEDATVSYRPAPAPMPMDPAVIPAQPGADGQPLAPASDAVDWSAVIEPPPGAPTPPADIAPVASPAPQVAQPGPPASPATVDVGAAIRQGALESNTAGSQPPPPVAPPVPDRTQQPPPPAGFPAAPAYVAIPPSSAGGRSPAHTIGLMILAAWGAIATLAAGDWLPDFFWDTADGWIARFFRSPSPRQLETREYYGFLELPDFISPLAYVMPIAVVVLAVVALVTGSSTVRKLVAVPVLFVLFFVVGEVVQIAVNSFDFLFDAIEFWLPGFILPIVGVTLSWFPASSTKAPSPGNATPGAPGVFYAPNQATPPPTAGPRFEGPA